MVKPRNVEDYRSLAAKRLPRMVFDYLEGGAESERGLRRNLAAFGNIPTDNGSVFIATAFVSRIKRYK